MKYIIKGLAAMVFLLGFKGFAQQESMYTQYMFNRLIVNPAYAGAKDGLNLTGLYRHQWTGFTPFNGDPRNLTFSAHGPIMDGKSGLGGFVNSDWNGVIQKNTFGVAYAFRFRLGKTGSVSLGLNAAFQQYKFNAFQRNPLDKYDPSLPNGSSTAYNPNLGAGLFYNTGKLYAGLSVQNLMETNINILKNTDVDKAKYRNHIYFTGGYDIRISNDFLISPSLFIRYVAKTPVQFDINCNFTFVDRIWVGATFRYKDALAGLIGFHLNPNMRIGYSYDYSFFGLNRYNTGTHEVMVSYDFGNIARSKLQIPRYF